MSADLQSEVLQLPGFGLELVIDIAASHSYKNGYAASLGGQEFAVGEVWLLESNERDLILPSDFPTNLIQDLRDFRRRLEAPPSLSIETGIKRGEWCSWMNGYWNRVQADLQDQSDEAVFDALSSLLFAESRVGYIAAYDFCGETIVEVSTRGRAADKHVWAQVDGQQLANSIGSAIRHIEECLRASLKLAR